MSLLDGRTTLVTGAGSGIGRGICLAIAESGGRVLVTDLDEAAAEETADEVRERGGQATSHRLDVRDEDQFSGLLGASWTEAGGLDGLVNNAGALRMGSALEATDDEWDLQFAINTRAVYQCCRLFAEHLIDSGRSGTIVNVASNAGKVGYPNMVGYNASKAAVIGLTQSLAAEWAGSNINVNAVCPGGVDTPMLEQVAGWISEREGVDPAIVLQQVGPRQLDRLIEPIEVGRVVTFLLSDQALIIRGQAINVDGGDTPY